MAEERGAKAEREAATVVQEMAMEVPGMVAGMVAAEGTAGMAVPWVRAHLEARVGLTAANERLSLGRVELVVPAMHHANEFAYARSSGLAIQVNSCHVPAPAVRCAAIAHARLLLKNRRATI
jgi:hypothetical protein